MEHQLSITLILHTIIADLVVVRYIQSIRKITSTCKLPTYLFIKRWQHSEVTVTHSYEATKITGNIKIVNVCVSSCFLKNNTSDLPHICHMKACDVREFHISVYDLDQLKHWNFRSEKTRGKRERIVTFLFTSSSGNIIFKTIKIFPS